MKKSILFALLVGVVVGCAAQPAIKPVIADVFTGFDIVDRAILPFGVPFVRSGAAYGNNKATALDVGPRGAPGDVANSGKAWIDVCDADLIATPTAPVHCVYAGAWSDHGEFGTRAFNGAGTQPLKLRIGDAIVGELNAGGLVIYGTVTAGAFAGGGPPASCVPEGTEQVLLHMDAAFVDVGQQCLAVTAFGNAHLDANGAAFDGNGDYLTVAPGSGLSLGSADWTYELTVKSTQTTRADVLAQGNAYTSPNWYGLLLNVGGSGQIAWYENGNARIVANGTGWNDGNPHVVKIARVAGIVAVYLDGVVKGSYASSFVYGNSTVGLRIGGSVSGPGWLNGSVNEFKLEKP